MTTPSARELSFMGAGLPPPPRSLCGMQHTLLPSPCTHACFPHVSRSLLTHATTAILCTRLAATALCRAQDASKTFYRRLIWRDLAYWQLYHWPRMAVEPIRTGYEEMQWESGPQAEAYLKAWQQGRTGFPLVDAGGWATACRVCRGNVAGPLVSLLERWQAGCSSQCANWLRPKHYDIPPTTAHQRMPLLALPPLSQPLGSNVVTAGMVSCGRQDGCSRQCAWLPRPDFRARVQIPGSGADTLISIAMTDTLYLVLCCPSPKQKQACASYGRQGGCSSLCAWLLLLSLLSTSACRGSWEQLGSTTAWWMLTWQSTA